MPVNCGSSQPPSARWVCASQRMPRSAAAPSPSPAASSASSAQAVCDAVDSPRPAQLGVVVGAQVLAPAAVRVLVRFQPRHRPADARLARPHAGRDQAGHHRAGAVDVVRAPPAEPRPVAFLRPQQPGHAAAHRLAAGQPLGGQRLDRVRGDVGRRRVDDLAEVAERQLGDQRLTLSASNAPQPPSLDCMPVSQVTPRCTAAADRGVAAVATRRSASSTSAVSSMSG